MMCTLQANVAQQQQKNMYIILNLFKKNGAYHVVLCKKKEK